MLKNRCDAMDVTEGSHVQAAIDGYARVQKLRDLLGAVSEDEIAEAEALWNETAE